MALVRLLYHCTIMCLVPTFSRVAMTAYRLLYSEDIVVACLFIFLIRKINFNWTTGVDARDRSTF